MQYSKLIGTPHSEANCWEIARLFYKLEFGVELKHYFDGPTPPPEVAQNLIFTSKGDFVRTDTPKFGDIILLRVRGLESHIAIYLSPTQILHSTSKTGCVIDRFDKWSKLVNGFYTIP